MTKDKLSIQMVAVYLGIKVQDCFLLEAKRPAAVFFRNFATY